MKIGLNADNLKEMFLTPDEFARVLKVSRTTIYRIIDSRKMPFYKINGSIRFKKDDVEEYIAGSRFEPMK